ncbi:MAG: hypothetical protein OQK71_02215 [Desulfobacter sp.]|nr:hypothetical protein [Desulfobacter sp.]
MSNGFSCDCPAGAAQNIVAGKFKELVEERSGGAYKVKIYHSASLGNETEILQQIQMGTVHIGVITGGPCQPPLLNQRFRRGL